MARGRKSKYDETVKPHLKRIEEWRKTGATQEQICDALGIVKSTFNKYLNEHAELMNAYKKGTTEFIFELKGRLAYLTEKHTLETIKVYKKKDPETGAVTEYQEKTVKEVDPDIAAINLLLKNLDRENWSNDPANLELRKQELELKKMIAETKDW